MRTRFIVIPLGLFIIAWLKVGYFYTDFEHGNPHKQFFIKTQITTKVKFDNPYEYSEEHPFSQLSNLKKENYQDYCKYRFGILVNSDFEVKKCNNNSVMGLGKT